MPPTNSLAAAGHGMTPSPSVGNTSQARWLARDYFRYPVSLFLGLEYGALVVIPALWRGRPFSLVYSAPVVAVMIALAVEWLLAHFRARRSGHAPPSLEAGFVIALVGICASFVKALLGSGTYATQIGDTSASPAASLATPFVWWTGIGVGLMVFSWYAGGGSRRRVLAYATVLMILQQAVGLFLAGSGGAFQQVATPLVFGALVTSMFKLRHVVLGASLLLLLWPTILQTRNQIRHGEDSTAALAAPDPYSRLSLDELLALAEDTKIPSTVLLSPLEMLRYGLVPRALDSDRPELRTGQVISAAAGGSPLNSLTFTKVGNLYAESGWVLLAGYVFVVTLVIHLLLMHNGPWAFAMVMATVVPLLGVESVFPNNAVGAIQAIMSTGGALLAYKAWTAAFRTRRETSLALA